MLSTTVASVMTRQVVTAEPGAPFKSLAALLAGRRVSAVPVVDDQRRPIGIVSEADLLRAAPYRAAGRAAEPGLRLLHRSPVPEDRDETAKELMTRTVVTARPEWSVAEAARTMERHQVKRLPVVDGAGRLVGVVSRSDLLRPFLRTDEALRLEIVREVLHRTLYLAPDAIQVHVQDGVVTLTGLLERRSLLPILERLCRSVPGVVAVHTHLRCADTGRARSSWSPANYGVPR
jgi:CBS domain-containing protein